MVELKTTYKRIENVACKNCDEYSSQTSESEEISHDNNENYLDFNL